MSFQRYRGPKTEGLGPVTPDELRPLEKRAVACRAILLRFPCNLSSEISGQDLVDCTHFSRAFYRNNTDDNDGGRNGCGQRPTKVIEGPIFVAGVTGMSRGGGDECG